MATQVSPAKAAAEVPQLTMPTRLLSEMSAAEVVAVLGLRPHVEGGFFRETYRAGAVPAASQGITDPKGHLTETKEREGGTRNVSTAILYMLTAAEPFGCWHKNESDVVHFWQGGGPIRYLVLTIAPPAPAAPGTDAAAPAESAPPICRIEEVVLGPSAAGGQLLQMVVCGGSWKAAVIEPGVAWALVGESLAPGFDYRDMSLGTEAVLKPQLTPEAWARVRPYVKARPESLPVLLTCHATRDSPESCAS